MAVSNTSISSLGASPTISLPMGMANWMGLGGGGISYLVNFTGQGGATGGGGVAALGTVTVQVSNDVRANPNNDAATQALARWNNHDTLVSLTTDKNSSTVFPLAYARLYCYLYTSGTIFLSIGWADASGPK